MKVKFRLIKIFLLLIAFVFLLNFTKEKNKKRELLPYEINIIDSLEKKFITEKQVVNIIKKQSEEKLPKKIEEIHVQAIENNLKNNPFVDSTNVSLDINGKLTIFIRQKTPILRVNNEKEQFYLTAKNQFLPLSPNFAYKCMLVDGNIQEEDRELLLKLVKEIKNDKLLITHIIGIKKVKNNSFTLLVNYGDYEIEFGELTNYKQKLENLKGFYAQYLCKVPKRTYKKIILKYNNQIVGIKNTTDEYVPKSTKK